MCQHGGWSSRLDAVYNDDGNNDAGYNDGRDTAAAGGG
jgi:hypothetical protein